MKNFKNISLLVMCISAFVRSLSGVNYQTNMLSADSVDLFDIVSTELRKPEYVQEILPNDFSYLNKLLVYGQGMHNRQEYLRSVFSVFTKVMGGSHYINAYACSRMLEGLPGILKPYFVIYRSGAIKESLVGIDGDMFDRFKETVNTLLYMQFSSQYEFFRSSPEQFFDELSQQIIDIAKQEVDGERVRAATKRFLELCIGKLIWSPEEHEKIWKNVKNIADSIAVLVEGDIITDPADADDLYWALVHRFNYVLNIVGADLPVEFYQEVKKDIYDANPPLFLTFEEQDICIQTKKESLLYALLQAEAKSRAYEKGIFTD